jgi:hypothetical protein
MFKLVAMICNCHVARIAPDLNARHHAGCDSRHLEIDRAERAGNRLLAPGQRSMRRAGDGRHRNRCGLHIWPERDK